MTHATITASAPRGAVVVAESLQDHSMRIKPISRVLVALAAASLLLLNTRPIWRIDLSAPQYPEGLYLQIFSDRFSGDVEKINGLNHYIGMATIHNEMFPEFTILPKVILALVAVGVAAALVGRRWSVGGFLGALLAFIAWAVYDMWSWGYDYGHNLDPHAAIKVEGMAYQPPLLGHKQLLNFDAWSLPDEGGWVLFAATAIIVLVYFFEWRRAKAAAK